jgi:2-dehydro-3-deoxy-D-arabinonate dehydratase
VELIRYTVGDAGEAFVGVRFDDGRVRRIGAAMWQLLQLTAAEMRAAIEAASGPWEQESLRMLPPIDGLTEVWASGVTYRRSREARAEESVVRDVYERVYDAHRPELFFKSPAWRVCGHDEPIGIRSDSTIDVPEPELALVLNASGELVGLTICNDVSSRSIEGENPLYLPQAKVYAGSCAIGPAIRPAWEVADPANLRISVAVARAGSTVWADEISTAAMHRGLVDLAGYLFDALEFPDGAVLSTGTGIVPGMEFTLRADDVVEVEIEGIGLLRNQVREGAGGFGWLARGARRPGRAVDLG